MYIYIYIYIYTHTTISNECAIILLYWNTISAVTWKTVNENIVADTFRSKKRSSALLVHEQEAPYK